MPTMFKSILFTRAYNHKYKGFTRLYEEALELEQKGADEIRAYQEERLQSLMHYCYKSIPFYNAMFKKLDLKPEEIRTVEDLEKLPTMNKDTIRKHGSDMVPVNIGSQHYEYKETGGSTGEPLRYRISIGDIEASWALYYAALHRAGYEFGDRVALLGGASLFPQAMTGLQYRMKRFVLSHDFISSFDMGKDRIQKIVYRLEKYKPRYMAGFASSLYLLAKHLNEQQSVSRVKLEGVFPTSEVLFQFQRDEMEKAFGCKAFDQYGANDGGVSAVECEKHSGMHADVLRGIMEVVDSAGKQVKGTKGVVLATSLLNRAQPFIRYEVGDMAEFSKNRCDCGRGTPLLKEIAGRTTDYLSFSNGRVIPGPVIVHLFRLFPEVKQYQVVQKDKNSMDIFVVQGKGYAASTEKKLEDVLRESCGDAGMRFHYAERIEPGRSGKWKFIVREVDE